MTGLQELKGWLDDQIVEGIRQMDKMDITERLVTNALLGVLGTVRDKTVELINKEAKQ